MLERVRKAADLEDGFPYRLALFFCEKRRKVFLTLFQNVRRSEKDLGALRWRNRRPFLKCRFSSIDCPVDIFLCCGGNTLDDFSGGGIPNFGGPAIGGVAVLAGDDHLGHSISL